MDYLEAHSLQLDLEAALLRNSLTQVDCKIASIQGNTQSSKTS